MKRAFMSGSTARVKRDVPCVFQVPFATSIYGLIGPNGGLGFAIGDV